jgi:hypothetical protein
VLLKLWTTHLLSKFWFTYCFGHFHFKRRNSFIHGRSFCCHLGINNRKISLFINPLHIYKETKHWQHFKTFRRSHESVCQKSLMTHVQNFEVLSTKYVSSSNFINTVIQMTKPKLDSLAPYY